MYTLNGMENGARLYSERHKIPVVMRAVPINLRNPEFAQTVQYCPLATHCGKELWRFGQREMLCDSFFN